jgi:hypothetical protein
VHIHYPFAFVPKKADTPAANLAEVFWIGLTVAAG